MLFMKTNKQPCVTNFLACREQYKIELGRLNRIEAQLFDIFKVDNTADLEAASLKSRSIKNHPARTMLELYSQQGQIFDQASMVYDCATALQKRRVEHQQQQLNQIFSLIEC
jgi:hypothetical protein